MARNHRIARNYMSSKGAVVFDCRDEAPDMSIQRYLERIFRYTKAAPSVYVVAYVYIDRFCQQNPSFRITLRNVHRLLITTVMVASKYVEDMNYRNSYYARVGGLTTKEMNQLEMDFLFLMKFKCHVNLSLGCSAYNITFHSCRGKYGSWDLITKDLLEAFPMDEPNHLITIPLPICPGVLHSTYKAAHVAKPITTRFTSNSSDNKGRRARIYLFSLTFPSSLSWGLDNHLNPVVLKSCFSKGSRMFIAH
ncbi:cyclin-U2-1 [Cucumis melo var. makuwa]|uniref:Cyclin-U2-1 n=1 Tax=Cucumis melo var. makuwa TaxID=1194695 RepID=A0A5D3DMD8_CUCMM|nr:cyclin-U2-1 [Cucumis melo var. makuwa]